MYHIFLFTFKYYFWKIGGAERDRTDDLLLARQALSQLSYSPMKMGLTSIEVVGLG